MAFKMKGTRTLHDAMLTVHVITLLPYKNCCKVQNPSMVRHWISTEFAGPGLVAKNQNKSSMLKFKCDISAALVLSIMTCWYFCRMWWAFTELLLVVSCISVRKIKDGFWWVAAHHFPWIFIAGYHLPCFSSPLQVQATVWDYEDMTLDDMHMLMTHSWTSHLR